jgi:hypothetical protein
MLLFFDFDSKYFKQAKQVKQIKKRKTKGGVVNVENNTIIPTDRVSRDNIKRLATAIADHIEFFKFPKLWNENAKSSDEFKTFYQYKDTRLYRSIKLSDNTKSLVINFQYNTGSKYILCPFHFTIYYNENTFHWPHITTEFGPRAFKLWCDILNPPKYNDIRAYITGITSLQELSEAFKHDGKYKDRLSDINKIKGNCSVGENNKILDLSYNLAKDSLHDIFIKFEQYLSQHSQQRHHSQPSPQRPSQYSISSQQRHHILPSPQRPSQSYQPSSPSRERQLYQRFSLPSDQIHRQSQQQSRASPLSSQKHKISLSQRLLLPSHQIHRQPSHQIHRHNSLPLHQRLSLPSNRYTPYGGRSCKDNNYNNKVITKKKTIKGPVKPNVRKPTKKSIKKGAKAIMIK